MPRWKTLRGDSHEIRQPLTAMAGAVGELGRMVPMEEDEKHLVKLSPRIGTAESDHHRLPELFARENL